jgi:lipid-binding SYLF domain-containing protein
MIPRMIPRKSLGFLLIGALLMAAPLALGGSKPDLDKSATKSLKLLYKKSQAARLLEKKARAVLVFPNVVKAGFMFGGQIGQGVLLKGGKPSGYYSTVAASYGLQAGAQSFGYALFFMNDAALKYLDSSSGFEVGVGPSIVVVDEGMGKSMSSTTLTQDVYAFIFDQGGLMAGMGLQGSKITRMSD